MADGSCERSWFGGDGRGAQRLALDQSRRIDVDQWKAHADYVDQCRKKKSLLLTGGLDRVMKLWSVQSHKCVYELEGEYKVPSAYGSLVDFDFDESKIIGLVSSKRYSRICLWRRSGMTRVSNPLKGDEGTFLKGTCMRYCDPEAVIGCADGTARVFDMYSSQCSQIIRMHGRGVPVTCLGLSDDDSHLLIFAGGGRSITMSVGLSEYPIAQYHMNGQDGDIRTLCYNSCRDDHRTVFAGSTREYVYAWDLRTSGCLWQTRVSRGAVFSVQHLSNDASTLIVGGADGVLLIVDQNTGEVSSRIVLDTGYCTLPSSSCSTSAAVQRLRGKRLPENAVVSDIPTPPITCVAVGIKKVSTAHNRDYIRTWKFN